MFEKERTEKQMRGVEMEMEKLKQELIAEKGKTEKQISKGHEQIGKLER